MTSTGTNRTPAAAQSAANKVCLARLKALGLVEAFRRPVPISPNSYKVEQLEINVLTKTGADYLRQALPGLDLRWTPGHKRAVANDFFFAHTRMVIDVVTTLCGQIRKHGGVVQEAYADHRLKELIDAGDIAMKGLYPDGLVIARLPGGMEAYFIEADMGSEKAEGTEPNTFSSKLPKYADYLTDIFPTDEFFTGITSIKVLTITRGQVRAERLHEVALKGGYRKRYWFTSMKYIDPESNPPYDMAGEVWRVPTVDGFCALLPYG